METLGIGALRVALAAELGMDSVVGVGVILVGAVPVGTEEGEFDGVKAGFGSAGLLFGVLSIKNFLPFFFRF